MVAPLSATCASASASGSASAQTPSKRSRAADSGSSTSSLTGTIRSTRRRAASRGSCSTAASGVGAGIRVDDALRPRSASGSRGCADRWSAATTSMPRRPSERMNAMALPRPASVTRTRATAVSRPRRGVADEPPPPRPRRRGSSCVAGIDGRGAIEAPGARPVRGTRRAGAPATRACPRPCARSSTSGGASSRITSVGPRVGARQQPAVHAPAERAVRAGDIGGVVVGEEVAIEHDDPPARHVPLRESLAVPLLGEAVGQPQSSSSALRGACQTLAGPGGPRAERARAGASVRRRALDARARGAWWAASGCSSSALTPM